MPTQHDRTSYQKDAPENPISPVDRHKKNAVPKMLLKMALIILGAELLATGGASLFPEIPAFIEAALNATMLALLIIPFFWARATSARSGFDEQSRAILRSSMDGFWIVDAQGRFLEVNDVYCQLVGYKREELLRMRVSDIEAPKSPKKTAQRIASIIGKGSGRFSSRQRKKDGSILEVLTRATLLPQGYARISVFIHDLSERRRTEETLRSLVGFQETVAGISTRFAHATAAELNAAIDHTLETLGAFLNADRAYLLQFNKDLTSMDDVREWRAEGIGSQVDTFRKLRLEQAEDVIERFRRNEILHLPDVEAPPIAKAFQWKAFQEREVKSILCLPIAQQHLLIGCFGIDTIAKNRVWKDEEIELLRAVSTVIAGAISRLQTEAALRKSESRLNFIVSSSPVTMYTSEPTPPFGSTYVSPSSLRQTGYSPAQFTENKNFWAENIHPQDRLRVFDELPKLKERGKNQHEYRFLINDGSYCWIHDEHRLLRAENGNPSEIIGYRAVITKRKQIEENLLRMNAKLERRVKERASEIAKQAETQRLQAAALAAAPNSIFITDRNATISWANSAFCSLTGYNEEEVLGKNPKLLKSNQYEPARYRSLWETILSGHVWNGETINRRKDGELYTVDQTITPVRTTGTEITHFISTNQDVTKQKQLETQFLQAQKMESVGRLASGVAHDFNNLLTVIGGTADLTAEKLTKGDPLIDDLQRINQTVSRAAALTRQLLIFSRKQVMKPEVLNLNKVLANMKNMLSRVIDERIDVNFALMENLGNVRADTGQIEQVLLNIVINAQDAMPRGGSVTIRTQEIELDSDQAEERCCPNPGTYIMLTIGDTGNGMDEETRVQVFEPFFTTKEPGKGTGLGLSTAYSIIAQSGGGISANSELGVGTTFDIYLPRVEKAEKEPKPLSKRKPPSQRGTETILVVEDEELLHYPTKRLLEASGYKVLIASNGKEALQLLDRYKDVVDLMLTDVVMPEMDGRELAAQLEKLRPHMEIVYTSGYTSDQVIRNGMISEMSHFISKPYSGSTLTSKIRKVIDSQDTEL